MGYQLESLDTNALCSERGKCHTGDTADAVNNVVNHLLANGVVAAGVVVGGILLAADQQLGVEELAVAAGADLVDGGRVQVDEEGTGDVFAIASLGKERLVRARVADILGVGVGTTIEAKAVLEKVAGKMVSERLGMVVMGSEAVVGGRGVGGGGGGRTAPKQSYRAGCRPGRGEGEESGQVVRQSHRIIHRTSQASVPSMWYHGLARLAWRKRCD